MRSIYAIPFRMDKIASTGSDHSRTFALLWGVMDGKWTACNVRRAD
jgi:hypothetical protein